MNTSGDKLIEAIRDALDIAANAAPSALSFEGTSPHGNVSEAIKAALEKAKHESPPNTTIPWKLEFIGGNALEPEPIFARIRIYPGGGEGGTGPHFGG